MLPNVHWASFSASATTLFCSSPSLTSDLLELRLCTMSGKIFVSALAAIFLVGTLQGCGSSDDSLSTTTCSEAAKVTCMQVMAQDSTANICERTKDFSACVSTSNCCDLFSPNIETFNAAANAAGNHSGTPCGATNPCTAWDVVPERTEVAKGGSQRRWQKDTKTKGQKKLDERSTKLWRGSVHDR